MAAGMVAGLLTAAPASALTTRACTQKGTRSNDTMTVNLTPGGTFVVCAFTGTDTINLRGSVDGNTILVIVLGVGAKTLDLGLTTQTYYSMQTDSAIILPDSGVTVAQTGTSNGSGQSFVLVCSNNTVYLASGTANAIYNNSGAGSHYEGWFNGVANNAGC
jgi:hypothetical protein